MLLSRCHGQIWGGGGAGVWECCSGNNSSIPNSVSTPGPLKAWVQVKQPFVGLHSLGGPCGSPPSHLWQGAFPLVGRPHPDKVQLVVWTMPFASSGCCPSKRTVPSSLTAAFPGQTWPPRVFCLDGMWPSSSCTQPLIKNPPVWRSENLPRVTTKTHYCIFWKTIFQRNLTWICTRGQLSYVPSGSIRHGVCWMSALRTMSMEQLWASRGISNNTLQSTWLPKTFTLTKKLRVFFLCKPLSHSQCWS